VKIDEGQQKIKIVRSNRQSNLRGSCQSLFSLCRHRPSWRVARKSNFDTTLPEFHNLKGIPQEKSYLFVRQWLNLEPP